MGSSEEGKSSKSEKSSSPAPSEQTNSVHVYPDWAAMQAYYGPRVALPPYYNSAVPSGHPPHPYMWAPPQAMMPPYGAPYAAIYSHGGVYAHPAVPLGLQAHANGMSSPPATATPLSIETPTKSTGSTDQGLLKKLKGFEGLAMSIGNGNAEGAENDQSQSAETEGTSDGSNGNISGGDQATKKRSREGTPNIGGDGKSEAQGNPVPSGGVNAAKQTFAASVAPATVPGTLLGPVLSQGMTTATELRNSANVDGKTSSAIVPQNGAALNEVWGQNERELKRERRKQSNRESARRSRLRKQAETEELARRVETLTSENIALKTEINRSTENSEKLRLENTALTEKLKNAQLGKTEQIFSSNIDDKRTKPVTTENLLSKVDNSGSEDRKTEENGERYEKKPKSGAKLHQLLDTNPRSDAVAAS